MTIEDQIETIREALDNCLHPSKGSLGASALDEIIAYIESLEAMLKKANSAAEEFERKWYLECDKNETLEADAARYKNHLLVRES